MTDFHPISILANFKSVTICCRVELESVWGTMSEEKCLERLQPLAEKKNLSKRSNLQIKGRLIQTCDADVGNRLGSDLHIDLLGHLATYDGDHAVSF